MSKGFFTIAQGADYQRMAYALALSLKVSQPTELSKLSIGVTAEELPLIEPRYLDVFDEVIEIPWDDHARDSEWKLENEWKSIYMTPYDETIKLDADMLFPSDISSWWQYLEVSDGVFATKPRNYRGHVIESDFYRKVFTANDLPNVYTAMFYFKKNETNFELFKLAEMIFNNWERFFYEFLEPNERPRFVSTDVVFAIAAKIMDYPSFNKLPTVDVPTFIHMKSQLQEWPNDRHLDEDWTKVVPVWFNKSGQFKVGNYVQSLPFHYHVKSFLTDKMISILEKKLGIA